MNTLTTSFIARLKDRDEAAWFELWQTFGPVIRAQLAKWGKGRIGPETVRDLSQETLAALSGSLDRYDPERGARFSTWLLAIAKHVLGDEMDRRMALKRGAGRAKASLDETWMHASGSIGADEAYEAAVFRAKVEKAIGMAERECDFMDFSVYRMRVFDGLSGKEVAQGLGTSEPTVSRRLARVRDLLRRRIAEVVATYSFTEEELREAERKGLVVDPNPSADRASDQLFDECLAEIYHQQMALRAADEARLTDA